MVRTSQEPSWQLNKREEFLFKRRLMFFVFTQFLQHRWWWNYCKTLGCIQEVKIHLVNSVFYSSETPWNTHIHKTGWQEKKKLKDIYHKVKCLCPWRQVAIRYDQNPFPLDYTSLLQNFQQKKKGLFELWPPVSLRKQTRTLSEKWSFSLVPFSLQQEE